MGLAPGLFQIKAAMAVIGEDLEVKENACINIREGIIESLETWSSCTHRAWGGSWLAALPQPANAHVHSADWALSEYAVEYKLEEAVAPPRGLKHRLLSAMSRDELVSSISSTYRYAWKAATGLLVDFREGGGVGCAAARDAASKYASMEIVILGRPGPGWPGSCDGAGLSSPLDYDPAVLHVLAAMRPSMAHVAETRRARDLGDFEAALKAGFNAIVHGVFLSQSDLAALAERGVGLVLCASSNSWHGLGLPPALAAFEEGVVVALGTDNAAWSPPDPWVEARVLLHVLRLQGARGKSEARAIMNALFVNGYILAMRRPRLIVEGSEARIALVDIAGTGVREAVNKEYALVKRITAAMVAGRVDGARLTVFSRSYPDPRL